MPLYEYRCPSCRRDFELLVRTGDAPRCPTCESAQIDKLLSTAAPRTHGLGSITTACPPPEAGPCGPGCCRLPG